jgi:hypothetical protein
VEFEVLERFKVLSVRPIFGNRHVNVVDRPFASS